MKFDAKMIKNDANMGPQIMIFLSLFAKRWLYENVSFTWEI